MRWLLDEMFPPSLAEELRRRGHEAVCVQDRGMTSRSDASTYNVAVDEERVVVTENFTDFATLLKASIDGGEPGIPVACVRKDKFPRGGPMAAHIAGHLHEWAEANPEPYPGLHWP